ncbi:hypothetical protein ZWY2020_011549 [Hordeum vulgare]|nr:hypothetical protein ZWY2020_011549 [Hordeum vulgare]
MGSSDPDPARSSSRWGLRGSTGGEFGAARGGRSADGIRPMAARQDGELGSSAGRALMVYLWSGLAALQSSEASTPLHCSSTEKKGRLAPVGGALSSSDHCEMHHPDLELSRQSSRRWHDRLGSRKSGRRPAAV